MYLHTQFLLSYRNGVIDVYRNSTVIFDTFGPDLQYRLRRTKTRTILKRLPTGDTSAKPSVIPPGILRKREIKFITNLLINKLLTRQAHKYNCLILGKLFLFAPCSHQSKICRYCTLSL